MPSQIVTVLGPVVPEEIGFTDAHNHVWIERVPGADPQAPRLDEREPIVQELRAYRSAGGSALVDCQPGLCGRDGNVLAQLAEESGVHIIASTGFHRRRYYGPGAPLWKMSAEEACDYFLAEIRGGLSETRRAQRPVRPGLIKIAGEADLAQTPLSLLEGAVQAARVSGFAIEMHTENGAGVEEFLDFILANELPPEQLVFCHVDKRPDLGLHKEVAEAGVMLEYDTFFRPKYDPDSHAWRLVQEMVHAGLHHRLALATDMADSGMWRSFGGGPGLPALVTKIKPRLEKMGIGQQPIRQLLGGNILRRLAIAT